MDKKFTAGKQLELPIMAEISSRKNCDTKKEAPNLGGTKRPEFHCVEADTRKASSEDMNIYQAICANYFRHVK